MHAFLFSLFYIFSLNSVTSVFFISLDFCFRERFCSGNLAVMCNKEAIISYRTHFFLLTQCNQACWLIYMYIYLCIYKKQFVLKKLVKVLINTFLVNIICMLCLLNFFVTKIAIAIISSFFHNNKYCSSTIQESSPKQSELESSTHLTSFDFFNFSDPFDVIDLVDT